MSMQIHVCICQTYLVVQTVKYFLLAPKARPAFIKEIWFPFGTEHYFF